MTQHAPPQPDADPITDAQIYELRKMLFEGPADARQLHGLVACHDALGRSHRRCNARELCAKILTTMRGGA
jgi:hypothetical protein